MVNLLEARSTTLMICSEVLEKLMAAKIIYAQKELDVSQMSRLGWK